MFLPSNTLTAAHRTGTTLEGDEMFGPAFVEPCSVIKLEFSAAHTTVRADSSGTRGFAHEAVLDARLLVGKGTKIREGDRVQVWNVTMRVSSVQPRYDTSGRIDHHEVKGVEWA